MLLRRYGQMQNTDSVLDIFIKTSTRSSKEKHWRICCGPLLGQLMWTSGPWTERSWGHRTWRHIIGWMASPPTSGWKHTSEISPSVTSCWTTCQRCTTGKLQLVHFCSKQVQLCLTQSCSVTEFWQNFTMSLLQLHLGCKRTVCYINARMHNT